ncbi:MAG: phosphoribosylaminoimidazolesuccinocarboxamide synthase [Patescibacteria group bacterium]
MDRIRHGSSKDVVVNMLGGKVESIDMVFTNHYSIFDVGRSPDTILGFGRARASIANAAFGALHKDGLPTHFRSYNPETNTINVEPFNVYELPGCMYEKARGRVVPLEIIDRRCVTEALIERGRNDPVFQRKMLAHLFDDVVLGAEFTRPLIECTTKYEPIDRKLSDQEAIGLSNLGEASFAELTKLISDASDCMTDFFAPRGFKRIDGKWEVAITYDGPNFVIVDAATPDEMRLVAHDDGLSHDKDPIRSYAKSEYPDWYASLGKAKQDWPNDPSLWPSYPWKCLPEAISNEVARRYKRVETAAATN